MRTVIKVLFTTAVTFFLWVAPMAHAKDMATAPSMQSLAQLAVVMSDTIDASIGVVEHIDQLKKRVPIPTKLADQLKGFHDTIEKTAGDIALETQKLDREIFAWALTCFDEISCSDALTQIAMYSDATMSIMLLALHGKQVVLMNSFVLAADSRTGETY